MTRSSPRNGTKLQARGQFSTSDVPALLLLVQWHAVAQQCIDDIDDVGQVAYQKQARRLESIAADFDAQTSERGN